MTTDLQPYWTPARVLVPAFVLLIAGCSAASQTNLPSKDTARASATAAPSTSEKPTLLVSPSSPITLTLTSSIADGAALTDPVEWIATVTGAPVSDGIDRVDFIVDDTIAWTEHSEPYQFNDDGNLLVPSAFAPGSHLLAVNVVTASGAVVSVESKVTTVRPDVPASLLGKTFLRYISGVLATSSDGSSVTMPAGDWSIEFGTDGVIRIVDTWQGKPTEAFVATSAGGLMLFGPTNWIVPEEQRGGFCDHADGIATMDWQLQGSDLTLSAVRSDPCAVRSSLFAGTWKVKP